MRPKIAKKRLPQSAVALQGECGGGCVRTRKNRIRKRDYAVLEVNTPHPIPPQRRRVQTMTKFRVRSRRRSRKRCSPPRLQSGGSRNWIASRSCRTSESSSTQRPRASPLKVHLQPVLPFIDTSITLVFFVIRRRDGLCLPQHGAVLQDTCGNNNPHHTRTLM